MNNFNKQLINADAQAHTDTQTHMYTHATFCFIS